MPGRKEMASKWRKAKLALGLNLCVYVPRTLEDPPSNNLDVSTDRLSNAALLSPGNWDGDGLRPMTPTPSSHGLKLYRSGSKSSKVYSFSVSFNFDSLFCWSITELGKF